MFKRLRFISGCLFFALIFLYVGVNVYRLWAYNQHDDGWLARFEGNRFIVSEVRPDGPAAEILRTDDVVEAINNRPLRNIEDLRTEYRSFAPGNPYTITVRRRQAGTSEATETFTLRTNANSLSGFIWDYGVGFLILGLFLFSGLIIFLLKPFDKAVFLLAMILAMLVAFPPWLKTGYADLPKWAFFVLQAPVALSYLFFTTFFLHLFLVFPETRPPLSPVLRRWPRAEWYIYIPTLLIGVVSGILFVMITFAAEENRASLVQQTGKLATLGFAQFALYISGGLISLVVNYRQADEMGKRRMRIVMTGTLAGFLPLALLVTLNRLGFTWETSQFARWLDFSLVFALPLIPLSFAYAIIRHKVIPISLIIRQGVRYLVVLRGFYIVQFVLIFFAIFFLFNSGFGRWIDSLGSRADIAAAFAAGAFAGLIAWLINRKVVPAIDRRFFREAYDAQLVLSDLGQAVRSETSVERMLELAAARIQDALHPKNVSIFLRDATAGDYHLAVSSSHTGAGRGAVVTVSSDDASSSALPRDSFIVERFRESSEPLTVDFGREESWAQKLLSDANNARQREADVLREVGAVLLIPIRTKENLLGILSLGERLGDLPYSGQDERLLSNVALQMAYAIENAELIRRTVEEEKLKRDVQMATEVQQRLLPARPPTLEALELAGSSQSARGIGGDYYDFLELDESRTGICVADVAGKGVSAALLMSIVQALLRSQASTSKNLTELVTTINRLMTRSTGSQGYATFFYAQFDASTRALTYVNAGHNPPMLIRRRAEQEAVVQAASATVGERIAKVEAETIENGQLNLLKTGGPVIGMFEHFTFDEETVQTEPGDVLVAYSDGLSEALNPAGEEYGEARIAEIAIEWSHHSAEEIAEKIKEDVRAWIADAPQHDDLTFVVAKVK
jgi:phosphoserine phosphatase RsbU/P